jgi:hypothetical protein
MFVPSMRTKKAGRSSRMTFFHMLTFPTHSGQVNAGGGHLEMQDGKRLCRFLPHCNCCLLPAGYFTSRPASKGFIRSATSFLQAARQLEAFMGLPGKEAGK